MPSENSSSREQVCSRERKLGPSLGVIQTGSQNQRNPNAPTFEERSIDWIVNMKEKTRKATWFF